MTFSLSGCIGKIEYVYVYRDCPKLQTIEPGERVVEPLNVKYTVKDK